MNVKMIGRLQALILVLEALFMLPALLLCVVDGDRRAALAFGVTVGICCVLGGLLYVLCRGGRHNFYAREGLISVGLSWIVISLFGCLPFWISGAIPSFIDAFFEIVSGFTTTGSSILPQAETLPRGILYWRSFSHWVGGMGVLVFLLAFSSLSGKQNGFTVHLLRAESPGPSVGKLVPRMKQTATILYGIYIGLTVLNIGFLLAGGMSPFDAVCTAFGTAGTGGFGVKNDSIAGYSPYLQNVCTVFMLLFGVNFSCYYLLLLKRFRDFFRDRELLTYFGIVFASVAAIAVNLHGMYRTVGETVRHAAFQVSSIMTTTGFATTDFDQWPAFSKTLLVCLMLVGACAGSTGGGLKVIRLILLVKNAARSIGRVYAPQRVQVVRLNGKPVEEKTLDNVNTYFAVYAVILLASFLLLSLDGYSLTTNCTAVVACFNNIGPGLELVGPTCNFSLFSPLSKLVLIFDMLAGRLEIFPILVLFSRRAWRRN